MRVVRWGACDSPESMAQLGIAVAAFIGSRVPFSIAAQEGIRSGHRKQRKLVPSKELGLTVARTHIDRDLFTETEGESAVGITGVYFTVGADDKAYRLRVESVDDNRDGVF